jgi:hypothetical protein
VVQATSVARSRKTIAVKIRLISRTRQESDEPTLSEAAFVGVSRTSPPDENLMQHVISIGDFPISVPDVYSTWIHETAQALARLVCDLHPQRRFWLRQSKENHMAKKGESKTNPNAESVTAVYAASPEADDPVSAVDHEAIARLAYSHWEARGCPIGSPEEDWYRAENELRHPITVAAAA